MERLSWIILSYLHFLIYQSEKLPYLSLDRRNEEATRFLSIIDILAVSLSSLTPFVPLGLMV